MNDRTRRPGGSACQSINFTDIMETVKAIKGQIQREKVRVEQQKLSVAQLVESKYECVVCVLLMLVYVFHLSVFYNYIMY